MPLSVSVITPYGLVVEHDDVDYVYATGVSGDLGVLPGHTPMVAALAIGEVRLDCGNESDRYAVGGGIMEVSPDKVTVTVGSAEHVDKIDLERAREAQERAEERLSDKTEDLNLARAEAALARALNRIQIREHKSE